MDVIKEFTGKYDFLSNFYKSQVEYEGIVYPTSEHAYQAAKSLNLEVKKDVAAIPSPSGAKKYGKTIQLRKDWEFVKLKIMYEIVSSKFKNSELAKKLLDTGDAILEEGNNWYDTYWGIYIPTGKGENNLGKILMTVRKNIKNRNQ